MATGTGKTLLCAALIRRFLATRNAERVLFIVDRIELAKQTMEDFGVVLRDYQPVIYKSARRRPGELLGSSVVIATIQSLLVDRRFRTEFTPFHFDLVINDEAHRSIYGDAREVVQFFQGTRIGLTATPKAYLKNIDVEQLGRENPKALEARELRDTYRYFGCEPGMPTFRYDIIDAVKDPEGPFLCMPKIFDVRSDITTQALDEKGNFRPRGGCGHPAQNARPAEMARRPRRPPGPIGYPAGGARFDEPRRSGRHCRFRAGVRHGA
jgi:type I restriction enzyme R subunit